ncbi:MAG: glycosyl transferase family 1, partial [Acidobacteria bacterium]|nr:glycosyl transferase family 1 [Acidobacteriota bacterium]
MSATLADYRQIIGADIIEELRVIAGRVRHRSCQHINAEPVGGEVAGALTRLIPFMRELGLEIRWNVLKGDEQFHSASRTLLRALGGKEEVITDALVETYASTMEMNYREIGLTGDI